MASTSYNDLLSTQRPRWYALLQEWSLSGRLSAAVQEALLLDEEPQALKGLVAQWSSGDFHSIPEIVLLNGVDMSGAMGAYALSTGMIYLNADWCVGASADQVNAVLTEELGHHLDGLLNAKDTPGDEGEYFSTILSGQVLSDGQKQALRSESETGAVLLEGTRISAETASAHRVLQIGSIGTDRPTALANGPDGSTVVTGYFSGTIQIGGTMLASRGGTDVFIAKLDSNGNYLWAASAGSIGDEDFPAMHQAQHIDISLDGSIYVSGNFQGAATIGSSVIISNGSVDTYLAKFTSAGHFLWVNTAGSFQYDESTGLTVLQDGSCVYTGAYDDLIIFGSTGFTNSNRLGSRDIFLAKTDKDGNHLWAVTVPNNLGLGGYYRPDHSRAIDSFADGSIVVAGYMTGAPVFGETTLVNTSGDYLADGFVAKADTSGNFVWAKKIGGTGDDSINDIRVLGDGSDDILAIGSYTNALATPSGDLLSLGASDIFVSKLDSQGNTLWLTSAGGLGDDAGYSIASLTDGSIAISGKFQGSASFGNTTLVSNGSDDIFVAKLDANGNFVWARQAGGSLDLDRGYGVTPGPLGSIKVVGSFQGKSFFGQSQITSIGAEDGFLASIDSFGNWMVNEAPTNLTLTSSGILENSSVGAVIGTLSAVDPDAGSSFTYALVAGNGINDADNGLVAIVDSQIIVKTGALIDFETNPTLNLYIQVTDNGNPSLSYAKAVTADVLDVLEDVIAPTISSIKVEGTSVRLKFSEIISAALVPSSAFSVATIDSLNRVTSRTISAIALDQNDSSVVILILTGAAPAVTSNLRVSYTDPASDQDIAVIQDAAGNDLPSFANRFADTFSSSVTAILGSQYSNLILTGTSAINGTGNQYANTLMGNSAKNVLNGGEGADYMAGGVSDDTYIVDNVDDYIEEGIHEGIDRVQSSVTYTLSANLESLMLTGVSAINGTGNESTNSITGNPADNVINGGAGADMMAGGLGNDTYIVDNTGDLIKEAAMAGTDTVWSSVTYTLSANLETLILSGIVAIDGTGNNLNNTLIGNIENNVLNGGVGSDAMIGGLGSDTYVVDNIADRIEEAALEGSDTVQTSISYSIASLANLENITLSGSSATNATGNAASNILKGNSANNLLDGGTGADSMIGGLGNDIYYIDDSGDVATEAANAGIDSIHSSVTHALSANLENLILLGSSVISGNGNNLSNTITGNTRENVLNGGDGNDVLIGGLGQDTLIGSNGVDRFVYNTIEESSVGSAFRDVIVDFNGSAGERVDLSRIDAFTGLSGNQAFTFIGANGFTGSKGEVRFSSGILLINTDTDKVANMEIELAGVTAFQSSFLAL
jgi:Ca2+-binding RTX toxin-like protein